MKNFKYYLEGNHPSNHEVVMAISWGIKVIDGSSGKEQYF